jgi:hypothetical protein
MLSVATVDSCPADVPLTVRSVLASASPATVRSLAYCTVVVSLITSPVTETPSAEPSPK